LLKPDGEKPRRLERLLLITHNSQEKRLKILLRVVWQLILTLPAFWVL
jgi:hypothetical protein